MMLNPPKAVIVLAALFSITLLLLFGRINSDAAVGLLGLIVGYGVGNGIAAKEGMDAPPVIRTSRRDRRRNDTHGDIE